MYAKSAVRRTSGGSRGSSTMVYATLYLESIGHVEFCSQDLCRNSIAYLKPCGRIERNPSRWPRSYLYLGGICRSRHPSFPLLFRGSISSAKRSNSLSREGPISANLSWVIVCGIFAQKRKSLGENLFQPSTVPGWGNA